MVATAALHLFELPDRAARGVTASMPEVQEFETFVRNYQNMVFSVAARILGNFADAEDITQETFIKAFDRFSELRDSQKIGGWLKTVATNLSINHLNRYRARWRFFSEDEKPPEPSSSPVDPGSDRKELLEIALRELPDAQRVPLVLFHFEEMSYEEISAKLGISIAKVKTDIYRGRQTLRQILQQSHE
jgi:RNA polymerase sigma-70 factor (ECF subfamily)